MEMSRSHLLPKHQFILLRAGKKHDVLPLSLEIHNDTMMEIGDLMRLEIRLPPPLDRSEILDKCYLLLLDKPKLLDTSYSRSWTDRSYWLRTYILHCTDPSRQL